MFIDLSQRAVTAAVRFEVLEDCTVPALPAVDPELYLLTRADASPAGYAWYEVNIDRADVHVDAASTVRAVIAGLMQLADDGVLRDLRVLSGGTRPLSPNLAYAPPALCSELSL